MFPNFDDNKDDDFLNEFRQKLNDQPLSNFEEKKNEINRSKNVFIGTISGIALAAVVGWLVFSPRYNNDADTEIPVIRRPQTAIKVQPTEPGGLEILNQDKTVYDIIEKKDTGKQVVENLLPPPEVPQLPTIAPAPEPEVDEKVLDNIIAQDAKIETKDVTIAKAPEPTAVKNAPVEDKVVPISQAMQQEKTAPVKEEIKIADKAPAVNIVIPAKVETTAPAVAKSSAAPAGSWMVQLMASNDKKAVDSAWNGLVKKYNVLQGLSHEVETADLGAKGTFYRLHAGAYGNKADADKLCNDIKALGGSCLVKKKQ